MIIIVENERESALLNVDAVAMDSKCRLDTVYVEKMDEVIRKNEPGSKPARDILHLVALLESAVTAYDKAVMKGASNG